MFGTKNVIFIDTDWERLFNEALQQAVLPLVFYGLSDIMPQTLTEKWKKTVNQIVANNMRVEYEHTELHELLVSNNIPICYSKVLRICVLFSAFRQLSEAKQKPPAMRVEDKRLYKNSPFCYNEDVQAYCGKKGELYGKPNEQSGAYQVDV